MVFLNTDGTISHSVVGSFMSLPNVTQAVADAVPSKPSDLIAKIDGKLNIWNGTTWDVYLRDQDVDDVQVDQFVKIGAFLNLATKFNKQTSFTVSFQTSSEHGSEILPIYYRLGISLTGAKNKNESIVFHSSELEPEILIPNKPSSPLATYAGLTNPTSPLSTYVNQAAMTANFASQVLNSYYYFTGSNTAWKYNGTATDSIANYTPELYMLGDQSSQVATNHYAYTGSTSMWLYNGTAGGVIGNYTEIVAVSGWQEWGIKPAYLTVIGDSYLVGTANLNELTFTFHKYYNDLKNQVVCNIVALTGANEDPAPPNLKLAILHNYNENESIPVPFDAIVNQSFYGTDMVTEIINPAVVAGGEVIYEPLGPSGNFSIFMGRFASTSTIWNNFSQRGYRILEYNHILGRLALGEKMTIISRISFPSGGYSAQDKLILEHRAQGDVSGFRFTHTTTGSLDFRMYYPGLHRTMRVPSGSEIPVDSGFWCIAGVVERTSPTEVRARFYRKSIQNSVPSTFIGEIIDTSGQPISIQGLGSDYSFDRTGTASTGRPKKEDEHRLYFDALTQAEIFAIFDEIDVL